MDYSHTQATHDEVNLLRLVQRLEKFVASEQEWNDTVEAQREKMWLQALGTLQVNVLYFFVPTGIDQLRRTYRK